MSDSKSSPTNLRVMRIPDVCNKCGLSKSTVWGKLNPNCIQYDSAFPKPFKLGATARAVGWLASEVDAWLEQQASQRIDVVLHG
ncbi:MAG: AlpA family transcriptional regulator [Burkholderiales bacterium]|nr:AlpA family transcriptional regulator [Burkholderiales bacterium]